MILPLLEAKLDNHNRTKGKVVEWLRRKTVCSLYSAPDPYNYTNNHPVNPSWMISYPFGVARSNRVLVVFLVFFVLCHGDGYRSPGGKYVQSFVISIRYWLSESIVTYILYYELIGGGPLH